QIGQTDFSADVLAMKGAGCDGIYTSMALASNLALTTQLRQAGVKLKASYILSGYSQGVLETAAGREASEGLDFSSYYAPAELNTPAVTKFRTALHKYGHINNKPYTAHYGGWVGADLAITGLLRAGKNPTWDSFLTGLRAEHAYNAGGILA